MFNDLKKLFVLYKERTFCYRNDSMDFVNYGWWCHYRTVIFHM